MRLLPAGPSLGEVYVPIVLLALGGCAGAEEDPERAEGALPLEQVHVVDLLAAPANVSGGGSVAVRGDGALLALVPTHREDPQILFFDGEGAWHSEIDRPGEGPEEYRRITALTFDDHDSLWVFDAGHGRVDVYGPELALARSRSVLRGVEVHWAGPHPEGGVIAASRQAGAGGGVLRLEWYRGDEVERLFEEEATPPGDRTGMVALDELRAAWTEEGVIVARTLRFGLHHVGREGQVRSVPVEQPAWWPTAPPDPALADWIDATPQLLAVVEAGPGEAWLQHSWTEPSADGAEVLHGIFTDPEYAADPEGAAIAAGDVVDGWMRNALQRVDLETGRVLEEVQHPGLPITFVNPGFAVRWALPEPDALVTTRLEVWRVIR